MVLQRWRRTARWTTLVAGTLALAGLAATPAGAQAEEEAAPETKGPLSKLSVHAFFNQAWAQTDGPTIEGITEDGTTEYRTLALQFRYAITLDDILVVQLQNESRGVSLIDETRDEVEIDWAFYEHRFNESAGIRLGRVRVPLGIYNEIRDVGTLLPFFEPPEGIYSDSLFTQESVDGAAAYYHFRPVRGWRFTADAYYGEWERVIEPAGSDTVDITQVDDTFGLQLWLETPVDGLRFGLAGLSYDVSGSPFNVGEQDSWKLYVASVDGTFDRWTVRAEYMEADWRLRFGPVAFKDNSYESYYGQLGYRISDRWTVWGQYDVADMTFDGAGFPPIDFDLNEDLALSVTYAPRSSVLFKAEVHSNEGFLGRPEEGSEAVFGDVETDYGVLSVSVAF